MNRVSLAAKAALGGFFGIVLWPDQELQLSPQMQSKDGCMCGVRLELTMCVLGRGLLVCVAIRTCAIAFHKTTTKPRNFESRLKALILHYIPHNEWCA